jgi:hypothetical protein
VAEIWHEMKKWCGINCKLMPFISPKQLLWEFLANASDEEATIFTLIIWHIWENRNGVRNGENIVHPIRIVEKNKSIYSSGICIALMFLIFPTGVSLMLLPNDGFHRRKIELRQMLMLQFLVNQKE